MSTKLSRAPLTEAVVRVPDYKGRLAKKAVATSKVESPRRSARKSISLAEARRLAIGDLLEAEARRQEERNREASFWAAMDEEA